MSGKATIPDMRGSSRTLRVSVTRPFQPAFVWKGVPRASSASRPPPFPRQGFQGATAPHPCIRAVWPARRACRKQRSLGTDFFKIHVAAARFMEGSCGNHFGYLRQLRIQVLKPTVFPTPVHVVRVREAGHISKLASGRTGQEGRVPGSNSECAHPLILRPEQLDDLMKPARRGPVGDDQHARHGNLGHHRERVGQ